MGNQEAGTRSSSNAWPSSADDFIYEELTKEVNPNSISCDIEVDEQKG